MARQNSSVRRVRPRRKSKGFKVVSNSLTWRWSGNRPSLRAGSRDIVQTWFSDTHSVVHTKSWALFFAQLTGRRLKRVSGVSLLPGWGFMLTFLSALWNDIKYPWYHSALLPVWYHQAGVLKLEIETCSKAPAPSSSPGEAAGCANSMSRSERFNYLILLSVPTPVSDFRVGRREFSACIQTDWRCDAVCERRVNLQCAEVVGWIYQLLSRHLYQKVFSAFFCCFLLLI